MAALAIIPYSLITQGVYSTVVRAISTITFGTCNLVKSIYVHKNPNITKLIKQLDIERRLKLINAILNTSSMNNVKNDEYIKLKLNDLEKTQIFEIVGSKVDLENDPIQLCLFYLYDIVQEINNNLLDINNKITYHNTKWFNTWRTLNINSLIENLKINSQILDSRFDDLTRVSLFLSKKC